ncbi:16S rRNA (guanine(966)-N(2))-methyltransferase RsmD [Actinomadura sp. HBU206391]|uniref:16S rRNA (guanine(966)-N(2))-methyltransferase RsmD n=1 Tax=Actinomadura sp. HBU206391 TaxID=2731692 RepID=UPI00164F063A|nr:16S rRNA (guanine(966)-N(2))-methyltransferase RsmD [Actinomadura sp. HBU206391]MBC6462291.1 16S rRNA (guanine(966)-N(2))-methyltransferase RsmD [Actinomadura sp. HBU206391]
MTRVIAGIAGGRRIAVPTGRDTRPTSDRAREGLFSTVLALLGPLDGCRVADLYAGSGAVGLEALSRGAEHALLVESHARAARVIRDNIAGLGLPGAELVADRVERVVRRGCDTPYDLIFVDPPYALGDDAITDLLGSLRDNGWTAPDTLVVVERAARSGALTWPPGYAAERERRYGEAMLWYGRVM